MIDRTFSNSLAVADIAPKAATKQPDRSNGDNGFGEALAGAHTVHDRRESQAAAGSRREWAHGDHSAERTRGQDRADEVRNDHATDRADAKDDIDEHTVTPTGDADDVHDADFDSDSELEAASSDQQATPTATADGSTTAAATAAAAGAATQTDADAVIVPTTTSATSVATDAVDAAMRLAIDADGAAGAAATTDADATVDADAQLAVAVTGTEDAETGDVEGPTRPLTSAPVATSGPSPVLGATVETEVATDAAPVVTAAQVAQVATSGAADVAAGTQVDAGAQQLVQATAVEADASATTATDDTTTGVTLPGAKVEVTAAADDTAAATAPAADAAVDADATLEADVQAPGSQGRANATTHVSNPTAVAQVQAHAQAQAHVGEQAEEGGSAATPSLDPVAPGNAQPLAAGPRDAQLAGARLRETLQGGGLQERIDHIAEQLATRLKLSHAAGGSQVQLSLKPRELGEVTVQMNVREGVVAATILVDKNDTLRTLETNLDDLKRSLESQGLAIQEFSVDVRGDDGAGGANARAAADLRSHATRTSSGSATSIAGAAAVIPGLSGDREVDPESLHDGDVSVLA